MSTGLRLLTLGMLVVFCFWVGFQYNDPDPALWMVIYGIAAVLTLLFLLGRLPASAAAAYSGLCLLGALYLAARVVMGHEFFFDEQGREGMGLLVVAAWSAYLARRARTAQAVAQPRAL